MRGPTFQLLPGTRREVEIIAKLFPQIGILRQVDRLNSFKALLDERRAQTLVSLLAIPGTAPGRTKPGDNFPQPGDVTRITHATANFWFR